MPLFVTDAHTEVVRAWAGSGPRAAASPWTATEFTSALSLASRRKSLPRAVIEENFDRWLRSLGPVLKIDHEHFGSARRLMRTHALLRAGDALHLAVAQREGLAMATLDRRLAEAARAEGLDVVDFGGLTT